MAPVALRSANHVRRCREDSGRETAGEMLNSTLPFCGAREQPVLNGASAMFDDLHPGALILGCLRSQSQSLDKHVPDPGGMVTWPCPCRAGKSARADRASTLPIDSSTSLP